MDVLVNLIMKAGGWAVFAFMVAESACIPVPSEVVLPFAGVLVSQGLLSFWGAVCIGIGGQLVGSVIAYLAGRWFGLEWLKTYGRYLGIRRHEVEKAERWMRQYGDVTMFFSRLIPIGRTFVSLPAGMARIPLPRFLAYSALGIVPWTIVLVYAGMKLGDHWDTLRPLFHRIDIIIVVAVVGLVSLFFIGRWRRSHSQH